MDVAALPRRSLPPLARVKQRVRADRLDDPRRAVAAHLASVPIARGAQVAITLGSRGFGGEIAVARGIADRVRAAGAQPFFVPAMGSHGGATAEGQTEVLRRLGATEDALGGRVLAAMDTIALGRSESGAEAHACIDALRCDCVVVLARVAVHPESAGTLASGLLKMTTVGLGKQRGAREAHAHGLWASVRAVPRITLARVPVLCGVAVVENALREALAIEIVPPTYDAFLAADERMLRLAKETMATIPFRALDLLIVDELGKNVSGAGMDPNVVGRWRATHHDPHVPDYRRLVALSLTPESLGNGIGAGLADFVTRCFADAFDPAVTAMNVLTASEPGGDGREASLPLALETDRDACEVALASALAGDRPRVCRIRSTARLEELWVSEALLDDVRASDALETAGELEPMPFDHEGHLVREAA